MKVNIRKFEAYRYLDSEEMIQGHLEEALNDGDPRLILLALDDIAKAKGMSKLAEKSGLGRESMYKALKPDAKPRFETIMKIIQAMGFTLSVQTPPPKALAEDRSKYKTDK